MSQGATTTSINPANTNNDSELATYQSYFATFASVTNNTLPKRKDTIRSCTHCQKALLTCDGGRPCQGCIKRDLSTTCFDATRKKSKMNSEATVVNPNTNDLYSPSTNAPFTPADQPIDFGFGSETTGLEYGILGNMLTDLSMMTNESKSSDNSFQALSALFPFNNSAVQQQQFRPIKQTSSLISPPQQQIYTSPPTLPMPVNKRNSTSSTNTSSSTSTKLTSSNSSRRKGNNGNTPEAVYNSVKKPFNYAEGFHYLIRYVTEKMDRKDLMRISRALSMFRPSFLSLIMNLTEEDLVFMEKCFQRTLLEYEKLISFSGTPTVVWRRTGEVCLVGKEFSLLTQWTRDMLLNKKTYIYELMENQSAVEYWEKFSTHAFDNTDRACNYSCILRTPQQKPVPCTFCFTIKRDIFDLPSVIVGNFLPILS
ncbi:MAG: hypothetical protein EXX96DRAFT_365248 [Benjaminiella poitrasii]|nr:MAG: hypothetical protein EXX96DRAFT_365248 [Benjaminiella poitrasii]